MTALRVLVEDGDVADFIIKQNLMHDVQVLEEIVFLPGAEGSNNPQVMLVGTIDGKSACSRRRCGFC